MGISLEQLNIPKASLESLLDFLPYPILLAEYDGKVSTHLYFNSRFKEEIGYSLEDAPGIAEWFQLAYPDAEYRENISKLWTDMINQAITNGESSVMARARIFTKYNGYKWFEVKSSLFLKGIQFVSFVNIDDVLTKEEQLERANHNKNKMLSILSHDLRSSMINLNSLADLALNKVLTPSEFATLAVQLKERSALALELLETTVHWTKTNFENLRLDKKPFSPRILIDGILETDNTHRKKNIRISQSIDDQLTLLTDQGILTIITRNLISNAVKFTPADGQIEIKAWQGDGEFFISIKDSGLGMNEELVTAILNDKYSPATGTMREKGSGVGLTLCRDLLKKIDGSLSIKSTPGKGTEMIVNLKQ
jgi:signal transduction histidine kinase